MCGTPPRPRRLVRIGRASAGEPDSVVWNAPSIAWDEFAAAIVRSTWDYIDDLDGFLASLASIAASGCVLLNDHATIAWNARKRYLLDLAARGVPARLVAATLTRLSA